MPRPDEELPLSSVKPVDEDVRQELADHIARRTDELIAQGWNAGDARAEATRVFGDMRGVADECRDITARARKSRRRAEWIDGISNDIRFAFRLLRRSPTFAAVAIATLALGVGANTAIFSLINGVLLRPLPFNHGEQLVDAMELHKTTYAYLSYTNFQDLRARNRSFQQLAQYGAGQATVLGLNQPIRATGANVTADFFPMMRVKPELGRLTTPSDHAFGAAPVAVVSDRFWREYLGANPDLASIRLRSDLTYQVVGVLPPGFVFPDESDIWVPLELQQQATSRTAHNWATLGRLRDGVSVEQARQDFNTILTQIGETAGTDFDAVGSRLTPLHTVLAGGARTPLLLLLGASGLLLLIACTNLASTLLARGTARQGELAVRTAIGAGRSRVVRQVFTESLVISVLGCGIGLALAEGLLRLMTIVAPPDLKVMESAHLDPTVLGFTALVAVSTAVLFGFLPALRMSDIDTGQLMRGSRGGSARRGKVWSTLVAVEVALAVVLLIGSTLLLRSFANVMHVDLGFDPTHVVTAAIDLPESNYPDVTQAIAFHDRALTLVRAIPGVDAAGVTNDLPAITPYPIGGIEVEGKPRIVPDRPYTGIAVYRLASTGFFSAMRIPIVRGRDFTEGDVPSSQLVAIVNQEMAAKEWPGQDPIGKRFRVAGMDSDKEQPWAMVIGVAHNVPGGSLTSAPNETYYFSYRQLPFRSRWLTAVVRSAEAPAIVEAQLRKVFAQADPNAPVQFSTMSHALTDAVATRRFMALLLTLFAVVALLLAGIGIYGVVAYSVAQRTREIGIRIALGATPRRVGLMVQGSAMSIVLAGIGVGVAGAYAATRLLQSLLYGVTPTDPVAFGGVIAILIITAVAASWAPARRGTQVDPITAIRAE
ncbi:MAG TPA: ABC transporter permease [Gemmatimonadales bacterium]|jgi:predicted permease